MNAPCTFILKNGGISQFFDVSYLSFTRNGDKTSLKQNLKTPFSEIIKRYTPSTNYLNDVIRLKFKHDLHRVSLSKKGKSLKELGTMSINQKKRCKKAVECMINTILFSKDKTVNYKTSQYPAFVTLTLPARQVHTDSQLRKLQTRYIENLQKTYNVKHYVWKAETQKNGNIHFHLLIDKWINWQTHRRLWNKQLDKLGYLDSYFKIHGHRNPNTTDVHSLKRTKDGKKLRNITSYIIKYMTKLEFGKRPIIGKIWGCSNSVKSLDYPKYCEGDNYFNHCVSMINKGFFKNVLKEDFYSYYVGKTYEVIRTKYLKLWGDVKRYYQSINGNIVLKKIESKPFIRAQKKPLNATQFLKSVIDKQRLIKEENRIVNNRIALEKFKQNYISAFGSFENQLKIDYL